MLCINVMLCLNCCNPRSRHTLACVSAGSGQKQVTVQDLGTDLGTALRNHFDYGRLFKPRKLKPDKKANLGLGQSIVFGRCQQLLSYFM